MLLWADPKSFMGQRFDGRAWPWRGLRTPCRGLLIAVTVCAGSWSSAQSSQSQGGSIHGVVKSGNMAVPGVTVTAANTLTGQKVTTSTDVDGSYSLSPPSNGRYVVRAQMAAFAPVTKEVVINATDHDAEANLELILLSRVPQTTSEPAAQAT